MDAEPVRIEVSQVQAPADALLAPDAREWEGAAEAAIRVQPTPLDRQPSAYVQVAWGSQPRSVLGEVRVRAASGNGALAVRLEWEAVRPSRLISDVNVYPDACALVFPTNGGAVDFGTMGSPEAPVRAWHWRAGTDAPFVVKAAGIGTVERIEEHGVQARSRWSEGRWQVVLSGPLDQGELHFKKGSGLPVAFAVWSGAARERAGLKAFSPRPCELRL